MPAFFHEKLDVYKASVEFLATVHALIERLPRGHGYLVDQLQRAATSITLNIAEGAGEFSRDEKHRFYRMSRRSATECAAILDVLSTLHLADATELEKGKELLDRIVAMLTRMQAPDKPDANEGANANANNS